MNQSIESDAVPSENPSSRVLVLGIGNLLWADEGFGVRAVEYLNRHFVFEDSVTLLDGGTQGVYLVQNVREADILVVFDAVDYGLPGGTLKRVEGGEVPKFLGCRIVSLHQTDFQEVLALAELPGDYPTHLLLVGVQPVELEDYGGSLRPEVKAQILPAVDMALDYLAGFGIQAHRRTVPLDVDSGLPAAIADIERYEAERPSEEEAFRDGDIRVLRSSHFNGITQSSTPSEGLCVDLDHHLNKYRKSTD